MQLAPFLPSGSGAHAAAAIKKRTATGSRRSQAEEEAEEEAEAEDAEEEADFSLSFSFWTIFLHFSLMYLAGLPSTSISSFDVALVVRSIRSLRISSSYEGKMQKVNGHPCQCCKAVRQE